MDYLGPFAFNAASFFVGAASLVPVILATDRRPVDWRGLVKPALVCGIVLFAASALQQIGVSLTGSAGKAGFLTSLYIILVPIFGIFVKRRAELRVWVGAALALVGSYFLCVKAGEGLGGLTAGDVLIFLGAFFWAGHILVIDRYGPSVPPLWLSFGQFVFNGILCVPIAHFTGEQAAPAQLLGAIGPILYRGLGAIGLSYTLQIIGQRHVAPGKAAVIFSLESVFSVLGGALLLQEIMTGRSYAGCALIFAGILAVQVKPRAPR
jgi:drug/metabolite transporter (DMT)-like permease